MHSAECRCMFCNALLGIKEGFTEPNQITHAIGECCREFALSWWRI